MGVRAMNARDLAEGEGMAAWPLSGRWRPGAGISKRRPPDRAQGGTRQAVVGKERDAARAGGAGRLDVRDGLRRVETIGADAGPERLRRGGARGAGDGLAEARHVVGVGHRTDRVEQSARGPVLPILHAIVGGFARIGLHRRAEQRLRTLLLQRCPDARDEIAEARAAIVGPALRERIGVDERLAHLARVEPGAFEIGQVGDHRGAERRERRRAVVELRGRDSGDSPCAVRRSRSASRGRRRCLRDDARRPEG